MNRAIVLGLGRGLEMLLWLVAFLLFVAGYRAWVVSEPVSFAGMPRSGVLSPLIWVLLEPVTHPAGWSYTMAALGVSSVARFLAPRQRTPIILAALGVSVIVSLLARRLLGSEASTWSVSICGAATFWGLSALILPHAEDPDQQASRVLAGQQEDDYESMKALAERLRRR